MTTFNATFFIVVGFFLGLAVSGIMDVVRLP